MRSSHSSLIQRRLPSASANQILALAALALLLLPASRVSGQNFYKWTGANSASWSATGNWNPTGTFSSHNTTIAEFNSNTPNSPSFDSAGFTVGELQFDNTLSSSFTISQQTAGNVLSLDGNGGIGITNLSGQSVQIDPDIKLKTNQSWDATVSGGNITVGTSSSTVNLNGKTLTLAPSSGTTIDIDGAVYNNGGAALIVNGAGTATLSGVNTYTGSTTITAGTLQITGSGSLNSGAYAGAITDNGALIYSSSATQAFSGAITGTGSLTKDTSSTSALTLSGNNTFTGGLNLNTGTVKVSTDANLGGVNNITSFNGGTLETTGSFTLGSTRAHTLKVTSGGGALTIDPGKTLTLGTASQLTGTGALTLNGTGTLALNANQNFGGTLNVASGTVSLGATQTFTGGTIDLAGGTTLNLNGYNLTTGTLNITGASGTTAIIDFTGSSILDLTSSLTIAAGVTLDINNWTNAMNYFYDASQPSPAYLSQIVFDQSTTPYPSSDNHWQPYADGPGPGDQITPVPEPATYGAIFMAATLGLFFIWQRRQATRPVLIPIVTRY